MKRTLVAVSALVAISAFAFHGSHKEHKEPLPNFDRRTDNSPKTAPEVEAPHRAAAVAALRARVPQLEITKNKVLKSPDFFSSRQEFLTGPNGEGLAVAAATARAFSQDDPHRAVKAFMNEHAGLIGYGADALKGAETRRDYVTAHNGMRTVIWQQKVEEIPVFDAITMGHITKNGELVNLYSAFVPEPGAAAARGLKGRAVAAAAKTTRLSAIDALIAGAANIGDFVTPAQLGSRGAAQGAAKKEVFAGSGALKGDQYAELVWLPLNANTMRLCWQVIVVSKTRGEGFLFVIDADTGEVVLRRCLTNYISDATYRVYTSDSPSPFSPGHTVPSAAQPPLVNRQLVVTPALNTNASPNGWINDGDNQTLGNNVDAHTDRNDDDNPDLPRPQGNPNRVFDFPLDLTQAPTTYSPAAVVQLFYWNNFIHDKLWELGFTEAAGNFQANNFGRGGFGNDAVAAQAQDGGGFNNANMLTLPDGFPPRMQMYLFDGPTPDRDGDLDAEVILHEYTHGLSNRRVGGGVGISQLQTAGMGEGWSDFYGLSLLSESTDPIDGNWAAGGYLTLDFFGLTENYYFGIRRYPYSTNLLKNPLTFKDIDPTQALPHTGIPRNPIFGPFTPFEAPEVHNQGEVWCAILWEVRANLIAKYGWTNGNQLALQLVTDAMALCPVNPNFVQSRDAILQADRINNNNANYNELWRAFAKRGLGAGATSPDSSTTQGVRESYDFPGLSIDTVTSSDSSTGNGNGAIDPNECVEIFVRLRNPSVTNATSITGVLTTTTPGVTVVQGTSAYPNLPADGTGFNLTPFRIYTSPDFVCGARIELTLRATGSSPGTQTTTNVFTLRTGFVSLNPILVNNNTPVSIPDANTNGVESAINVSGMSGALGKVTVSVHLTHPAVGDLVLELISPDGTVAALAKNQGADGDNFGSSCTPLSARTTFDDNAPFEISVANPPYVGTFRPDEPLDVFEGKFAGALNGTWRLRVIDSGANDVGTLQCWTLSLFPTVCTNGGGACASDIAVSATATPAPAYGNIDLTYAVAVTNMRPIAAMNVTVTNVLPAGVTFISASPSQGTCSFIGGAVRCNLGTLAGGAAAAVSIVVQPTLLGSLTNTFSAGASADSNPTNNSVSVVSTVVEALPQFVADGAQVTVESFTPATGGIESGETVTVNLSLRNVGPIASGSLVATLLEGSGVSASSGSQTYGAVVPGTSGVGSFQFTATGGAGSMATAVLALQDGARNLGTVSFQFTLGGEVLVENITPITINTLGSASPYPSTLNVSGAQNVISKVRVTFTKLSHTFPDDIDAMLVGPRGQRVLLMSDAGGSSAVNNRTVTFDDAAGLLPDESTFAPGNYRPTDYNSGTEPGGDIFPAPAPVGARSLSLGAFNGTDPNGTWSLFVHDDGGNDSGSVSGGWSLLINTVAPVNPVSDLQITSSVSPAPLAGEPFTITLTVFNNGPSNATSVVVNDVLPVGMESGSASVSQGTVSMNLIGGTLVANLGTISNGASATISIQLQPNSVGLRSNVATVSSGNVDLNAGNNVATSTFTVGAPASDLGLRVVVAPSPVFVSSNVSFTATITNAGPNHAEAVRLTNRLAAGLVFASVTNSQGSCSFADGILTCEIGDINPNGTVTVVLHATAISEGAVANLFAVNSFFADAAPANNATNVVTVVSPLSPVIVASGVALTAESPGPANGTLDSGETVTVSFGLRNAGTAPTANLVATLLASGGVSAPSAPQSFGILETSGATVARPFTFAVGGAAGSVLTATLQLQDGAQNLGTATFSFGISANRSFTNNSVILIPNQGVANTYPSTITVAGVAGSVSKVTVDIRQLTHSFPEDIDMLLVGPSGQKVLLMSDAGAGNGINNVNLTLNDSSGPLPFASVIASGTYRPTDYAPGETFAAPAPAGPYSTNLSAFNGANPNGVWSLYVVDDATGDAGRIDGGWAVNIQTAAPVPSSADLAVTATAPASAESGELISYSITVANHGPAGATGVTLSDALPPSFALTSVVVSQGSYSTSPTSVTANLGTLTAGASAVVTINGSASGPRTLTNAVSVSSAQSDVNSANNAAVVTTFVSAPLLTIQRVGANAVITWRSSAAGYVLESSANASGGWAASGLPVVSANGTNTVTVPAVGTTFYRLRK